MFLENWNLSLTYDPTHSHWPLLGIVWDASPSMLIYQNSQIVL